MSLLSYLVGVAFGVGAFSLFHGAQSAIHQCFAAVLFLSSVICFATGALLSAITGLRDAVEQSGLNSWNIGKAIFAELRTPGGNHAPAEKIQE